MEQGWRAGLARPVGRLVGLGDGPNGSAIHHLGWWSPTQKWLTKMSVISLFWSIIRNQNIYWQSRMADQNYKVADIFISHFWVGDHHTRWWNLGWWSPTQKWLTKIWVICNFGQPFQIVNIFWSRMADQNRKMAVIFVSYFWMGDHHLGDKQRYHIYILFIIVGDGPIDTSPGIVNQPTIKSTNSRHRTPRGSVPTCPERVFLLYRQPFATLNSTILLHWTQPFATINPAIFLEWTQPFCQTFSWFQSVILLQWTRPFLL
jgi:hypothetical protein